MSYIDDGEGGGDRTRDYGFAGHCSSTELLPLGKVQDTKIADVHLAIKFQ